MTDYTQSDLLKRGWSLGLIKKLLGEPDRLERNPYRRTAPPMKLYLTARVTEAEKTQSFIDKQAKNSIRQEAARKAIETKRSNILQYANSVKITYRFPDCSDDELRDLAVKHRQELDGDYYDNRDYTSAPEDVTQRWIVNYLRHICSTYDNSLIDTFKKTGRDEAHHVIKCRVLDHIADVYPQLRNACNNQRHDWRRSF